MGKKADSVMEENRSLHREITKLESENYTLNWVVVGSAFLVAAIWYSKF